MPPLVVRQTSLHESFQGPLLEDVQFALAEAIFSSRSSFSLVNKDEWKHAWKKIGEF